MDAEAARPTAASGPSTGGAGLRERKRTAAMYRIQSVGLDLFEQHGFDAVTVEQIAEASDVSASSVYRYFGSKEQIVLWDELDPAMSDVVRAATRGGQPFEGIRAAVTANIGSLDEDGERRIIRRLALVMSTPALETAVAGYTYAVAEVVGEVLASEMGRDVADLETQVFAHTLVGGLLGALHHWHGTGFAEPLRAVFARCFDILEEGLDVVVGRSG